MAGDCREALAGCKSSPVPHTFFRPEQFLTLLSYIIHTHFYQPPREDPLTGQIPLERGACPYLNWNEKIYTECYQPNVDQGNLGKVSFNIGPTLFSWLETQHPDTCQKIIDADRQNVQAFGNGNAMAQAYNHTILPLASRRDKVTQVAWGIADFIHRFQRKPQGMWLPETAMDLETLEVLADFGIEFTILAPWQAEDAAVDPSEPYLASIGGKRSLTVFFYHQELSTRISFDPWATINADQFAEFYLMPAFNQKKLQNNEAQVLMLASDGELYGHHQPLRNYFLERLVDGAVKSLNLRLTYPAQWLKEHPARQLIGVRENTAWSCHHGLGRWLGDCECNGTTNPGGAKVGGEGETPGLESGAAAGAWKVRLRRAFLQLAGALDGLYLEVTQPYFEDPWSLRDRYIHVILGELSLDDLLFAQSGQRLKSEARLRIHQMLEAQRERQRMFTSCGWFFDTFDRIEPQNVVAYAAQAVLLARQATGVDLTPAVLEDLNLVVSQDTHRNAGEIFSQHQVKARQKMHVQVGFAD
jgi:alpha-amylase/alpha-mannosidase (GH57 family)